MVNFSELLIGYSSTLVPGAALRHPKNRNHGRPPDDPEDPWTQKTPADTAPSLMHTPTAAHVAYCVRMTRATIAERNDKSRADFHAGPLPRPSPLPRGIGANISPENSLCSPDANGLTSRRIAMQVGCAEGTCENSRGLIPRDARTMQNLSPFRRTAEQNYPTGRGVGLVQRYRAGCRLVNLPADVSGP